MCVHPCTKLRQGGQRQRHTKMHDRPGVRPGRVESCDKSSDRSTKGGDVGGTPKYQLMGGDVIGALILQEKNQPRDTPVSWCMPCNLNKVSNRSCAQKSTSSSGSLCGSKCQPSRARIRRDLVSGGISIGDLATKVSHGRRGNIEAIQVHIGRIYGCLCLGIHLAQQFGISRWRRC